MTRNEEALLPGQIIDAEHLKTLTPGERIGLLRRVGGWDQGELAEMIERSRTTVSDWETDKATPSLDSAMSLARLFGVTVEMLTGL